MSSFLAVLISVFGVLGGALVYAWQKVVDRKEAQRQELKDAYRAYMISVEEMSLTVPHHVPNFSEMRLKHRREKQLIRLLAPKEVVEKSTAWEAAVLHWQKTCISESEDLGDADLREKAFDAENELMEAIRQDLDRQASLPMYLSELIPFARLK